MRKSYIGKRLTVGIVMLAMMLPLMSSANSHGEDYYGMVEKLKANSKHVDFKALRMAYTKTQDYRPYGSDENAKNQAHIALNNKNFSEAARQAENTLKKNYVDLDAHLISMIAYRESGNLEKSSFHNGVLKGLVNSIYSSGDGKSPGSAFVVISVAEEYFFLNANRLKKLKSASLALNGRHYDKVEAENKKTGEKSVVYFDISIPYGWLSENLKKKN